MRDESLLVLTLTRRCDRRCGFCPQAFADVDMSERTLDAALDGLLPRLRAPRRVKLFGGEPLLRPDLVARALDALAERAPDAGVELSTHGGGLAAVAGVLARRPAVDVFFSRALAETGRLPRAVHNFLLAPGETPARTAARLLAAREAGFARFNFLPAYFVAWPRAELEGLRGRFAAARRVLDGLAARGRAAEVVNLARRGTTALFNDGLVVDADGEVYASNLALAAGARTRRGLLRLGRAAEPGGLAAAPAATAESVLEASFPREVVASTRAVDALLSEFCAGLAGAAA